MQRLEEILYLLTKIGKKMIRKYRGKPPEVQEQNKCNEGEINGQRSARPMDFFYVKCQKKYTASPLVGRMQPHPPPPWGA